MEHTSRQISPQILYLLDSAHIRDAQAAANAAAQTRNSRGERWCCAVCREFITDEGQRIPIDGGFDHYKINPQGQAFQFRSFLHAEGCVRAGQPTGQYSWYTGYEWQFAHCGRCRTQLGWYFSGPQPFYGLINRHLVRCSEEKSP